MHCFFCCHAFACMLPLRRSSTRHPACRSGWMPMHRAVRTSVCGWRRPSSCGGTQTPRPNPAGWHYGMQPKLSSAILRCCSQGTMAGQGMGRVRHTPSPHQPPPPIGRGSGQSPMSLEFSRLPQSEVTLLGILHLLRPPQSRAS